MNLIKNSYLSAGGDNLLLHCTIAEILVFMSYDVPEKLQCCVSFQEFVFLSSANSSCRYEPENTNKSCLYCGLVCLCYLIYFMIFLTAHAF